MTFTSQFIQESTVDKIWGSLIQNLYIRGIDSVIQFAESNVPNRVKKTFAMQDKVDTAWDVYKDSSIDDPRLEKTIKTLMIGCWVEWTGIIDDCREEMRKSA